MRLPYIPADPTLPDPADQEIVNRVKERRGGTLIALDRALLHSPPVADGWNAFLKSIRTQTSLSASVREAAICRVAVLNKAWYEWEHHKPILDEAGVMSAEAVEEIKKASTGEAGKRLKELGADEKHAAVLDYTDAMTVGCVVPQALFDRLKKSFSDKEVVEITATVGAYNCVSRFLVALDVGEMSEKFGVDMK